MRKIRLEEKHYQWGLTAFLVIICCVLVFFAIYRFDIVRNVVSFVIRILSPFIYGLVMAYLLGPIYNFSVRGTYSLVTKSRFEIKHDMAIAKSVGTIISVLLILVVLAGVSWMILPGLVSSIMNVVEILPAGLQKLGVWMDLRLQKLPIAQETIDELIKSLQDWAIKFATDTLLPQSKNLASGVSQGVMGAVNFVMDFLIGIIISVYFLNSKDTFLAQIKKLILATFKEKTAEEIFEVGAYTNRTFGGFISGKIIDSAIIGLICFCVMSIFGWEYTLLISCIVGITNIIPFFGPFIGAIPSALLLLMVNPMHALYFLILIVILQQFDGNILGPKILGDSTGLESFWVLFAVLVGGGLFGFIGMVIGIPVFAVLYYYIGRFINRKLERKGFSSDLNDYRTDPYRSRPERKKRRKIFKGKKKKKETGKDSDEHTENKNTAGKDTGN